MTDPIDARRTTSNNQAILRLRTKGRPVSESATLAVSEDALSTPRWSPLTRIAFRFAFCYFLLYAACCGNATLWEVIPFHWGEHLEDWCNWPFRNAAEWLGQHLFHLTGVGAKLHDSGSGDRALDWIAVAIMLGIAIVATLLWTLFDSWKPNQRRVAYPKLFAWFRLILRLTLAVAMFNYGLDKLFPLQMAPPSLAVLNEPFGNLSPMTLLWTMIGLNPLYEMVCGAAEVIAGLLILFRRTALLGALITAFVVTNVVLYNYFFDVPVKLYATHLLLIALVLILPDVPALFSFFWKHRPSAPSLSWSPWPIGITGRKRFIEPAVTALLLLIAGIIPSFQASKAFARHRSSTAHPAETTGQWHVDAATLNGQPKPFLTGDGLPLTDIFMEPSGRAMLRDSSTVLWRAHVGFDDKKHTVQIETSFIEDSLDFAVTQPDATHSLWSPTGKWAKATPTLLLTHVPLPQHYPLLDRGFHLINEWGLER